jgi:hypothetical protein
MLTSDSLEEDLMLGLTDGSRRRGSQRTKWTGETRRTMTMNWHDTINVTQSRTQWRDLMYKAVENRKRQNEND